MRYAFFLGEELSDPLDTSLFFLQIDFLGFDEINYCFFKLQILFGVQVAVEFKVAVFWPKTAHDGLQFIFFII